MTLDKDRPGRPPMKRATMWIIVLAAVAVLVFVGIVLAVSGQSLF
jgi:hypothetical protein